MAYSYQDYTTTEGQTEFIVNIDFLSPDHIHVLIERVETEDWDWIGDATIKIKEPVPKDTFIRIQRITPRDVLFIQYSKGAPFIRDNLDTQNTQFLFISQEIAEGVILDSINNNLDMHNYRIVNLANPIGNQDATNKQYVDEEDTRLAKLIEDISTTIIKGWVPIVSFEKGATLKADNEILLWELNRQFFKWNGAFPKIVPLNSTPETTGGYGSTSWTLISLDTTPFIKRTGDTMAGGLAIREATSTLSLENNTTKDGFTLSNSDQGLSLTTSTNGSAGKTVVNIPKDGSLLTAIPTLYCNDGINLRSITPTVSFSHPETINIPHKMFSTGQDFFWEKEDPDETPHEIMGYSSDTNTLRIAYPDKITIKDGGTIVGTNQFSNQLENLGFQHFPNGLLIQWGGGRIDNNTVISFPVKFSQIPFCVLVGDSAGPTGMGSSAWTEEGFTFRSVVDVADITWMAIGKYT